MRNLLNKFLALHVKVKMFTLAFAWTGIFVFCLVHNNSNKRFSVTQFQATELQKATTQVQVSPALAWDKAAGFSRTLGVVFLIVMWGMFAFTAADLHLKFVNDVKKVGEAAAFLVWIPALISAAFFLANYSSMQQNNYVEIPQEQFYKWEQERKIEQKGERTFIDADESKVLKGLFDGKQFIK